MWIDRSYQNRNWNPAIGQTVFIKGQEYLLTSWGKNEDGYFWILYNHDSAESFLLNEDVLYNKLLKYGMI